MRSSLMRTLALTAVAVMALSACARRGFVPYEWVLEGDSGGARDIATGDLDAAPDCGTRPDRDTAADVTELRDGARDTGSTDSRRPDARPRDSRPADQRPPDAPLVPVSFLTNGDFAQGKTGWVEAYYPGCGGARTVAIVADAPYTSAVELKATGAGGCFGTSRVEQPLSVAVNSYSSITLDAAVRAVSCSVVRTCGVAGTEHVLILAVHYTEGGGTAKLLVFGIYYSTGAPDETCASPQAPANETWVTRKVQKDTWSSFSSGNLKTWIPAGSTITRLVAYASGWDYLSRVTNIQLVGQP